MLIGDQTQSNLLRVVIQKVDDVEQGSVMPFFEGLESGVMRPVFLPDGSLLLGQTGRGWQAKGGKVASAPARDAGMARPSRRRSSSMSRDAAAASASISRSRWAMA